MTLLRREPATFHMRGGHSYHYAVIFVKPDIVAREFNLTKLPQLRMSFIISAKIYFSLVNYIYTPLVLYNFSKHTLIHCLHVINDLLISMILKNDLYLHIFFPRQQLPFRNRKTVKRHHAYRVSLTKVII